MVTPGLLTHFTREWRGEGGHGALHGSGHFLFEFWPAHVTTTTTKRGAMHPRGSNTFPHPGEAAKKFPPLSFSPAKAGGQRVKFVGAGGTEQRSSTFSDIQVSLPQDEGAQHIGLVPPKKTYLFLGGGEGLPH